MKKYLIVIFIFFTVAHAGDVYYKQAYNNSHGFKIEYPSDWTLKSGVMGNTLFKASKILSGGFPITASVNAQLLQNSGHSMDKISLSEVEYIMTNAYGSNNVTVRSKKRLIISNIPAADILFDVHLPGYDSFLQYAVLLVKGKYLYTISIGCPPGYYYSYKTEFSHIANSFKFYK